MTAATPSSSNSSAIGGGAAPLLPGPTPLALRLGWAGLLPFVVGALLVWLVRPDVRPLVADGLVKYAALIVSFLGGIHWGLGLLLAAPEADRNRRFAWAVAPSVAAWLAVLMAPDAGLVLQALLLIACYLMDRRVYRALGLAPWLTLRFRLTAVASLGCFLAAAGH